MLEAVPRGSGVGSGHLPFTPRAKKVLERSLHYSTQLRSAVIGPEHVLLSMLGEPDGIAAQVLLRGGRSVQSIREAVMAASPTTVLEPGAAPTRTPAMAQALELADQLAGGAPVGSQHVLEALARIDSGVAGRALAGLGVTVEALAGAVDAVDVATTSDLTPEHTAAASLSWMADDDTATLTTTDPALVAAVRRLVEHVGGPLTGEGPLTGAFVAVHSALTTATAALDGVLDPRADGSEELPAPSVLERLRRYRQR